MNRMATGLSVPVFVLMLAGCGQPNKPGDKLPAKIEPAKTEATESDHSHAHQGHAHQAPHNGALVALGDEFAHLELLLDVPTGRLTAYVLDGEPEKPVRVKQEWIEISVALAPKVGTKDREPFAVKLKAVASALTGEFAGDSSQFECQDDRLKNATDFDGKAVSIEVKGQIFKDVSFNFPKGNE